MSTKLLKEFISDILLELKKQTPDDNLKPIGVGTTRLVYKLNDEFVLKKAKNKKGVEQNKRELSVYNSAGTVKQILAKVELNDENSIKMEYAEPLDKHDSKSMREMGGWSSVVSDTFKSYFGIHPNTLERAISYYEVAFLGKKRTFGEEHYLKAKDTKIFKSLVSLIHKFNLLPNDLTKPSSWGKTKGGRIVLIDYGALIGDTD